MFLVNKTQNKISEIKEATFSALGFNERQHLQEWIADYPECLDEDLLIIQKEFDGFNDTNERLDLLALDKDGSLVIIENKLDDSGRDVTWQALKYVSYCATLQKDQIVSMYQSYLDKYRKGLNAVDELVAYYDEIDFEELSLNTSDQRIIMVAGNYRKEVTSTVMWLLNHNIRLQCFKATPYIHGEDILLDIEQIIPVKEAEEYIIKMADKTLSEKKTTEGASRTKEMRRKFWTNLLEEFSKHSASYSNVHAGTDHWLSTGSGVSGLVFQFVVTNTYAQVALNIASGDKDLNKRIFDSLLAQKDEIEKEYGMELDWNRLEEKISSSIYSRITDVSFEDIDTWPQMIRFLCAKMPPFDNALRKRLKDIK